MYSNMLKQILFCNFHENTLFKQKVTILKIDSSMFSELFRKQHSIIYKRAFQVQYNENICMYHRLRKETMFNKLVYPNDLSKLLLSGELIHSNHYYQGN